MMLEGQAKEQIEVTAISQDSANAPTHLIHAIVTSHIEPVTRFTAADLREREPEQAFGVALELKLDQQVSFSIVIHEGPARLLSGTDEAECESDMRGELDKRLSCAIEEAPEVISRWAALESGSYRRLMPGTAAFLSSPGRVGYEYDCGNCLGVGKVICSRCQGKGSLICFSCHGRGRIKCYSCQGIKRQACSRCSGRGSWTEYITVQAWDSATSSYVSDSRSEFRVCSACNGQGQRTCFICDFDGTLSCSGCSASGSVACGGCASSGQVDCSACMASGIRHKWGTIESSVEHAESLAVSTDDDALEQLVRAFLPLDQLPAHGELLTVQNEVNGSTLCTRHLMRLDVLRASIEANGREFVIHALGPEPRVYSFENIAGHLLEVDLATLEAKLDASSGWKRKGSTDLLDATKAFLSSELNMLLAERVTELKTKSHEAAELVERHFHGIVAADYVNRATTTLRAALSRLYGAEMARPALQICAVAAVAASSMYGFSWPNFGVASAVTWSLVGSSIVLAVLDWSIRRRISAHFGREFGQRVLAQLSADGTVVRWRIGMVVAAACAVGLGVTLTHQLSFVRSHHAHQQKSVHAGPMLASWDKQQLTDFSQRSYPPASWLQKRSDDGDTRA